MKKILLIVLIAFTLTVCVAPVQSVEERCFDFANEKVKDLKCPKIFSFLVRVNLILTLVK
jgi:PBP1b-binding outer membrane lipoprotein LpoB